MKNKKVAIESSGVEEGLKKIYRTPKLTVHGTVKKITAAEPTPPGKPHPGAPDQFASQPFSN